MIIRANASDEAFQGQRSLRNFEHGASITLIRDADGTLRNIRISKRSHAA
jgi:uncharacterized protein YjhX (UPF0386 family)